MQKKNSAAAPYMMPMRLWSTVVIHDVQPVLARGRPKMPMGRCAMAPPEGRASASEGLSAMAISLLQRLQVGDEGIDLCLAQFQVGHAARRRVHGLPGRGLPPPGLELRLAWGCAVLVG